MKINSINTSSPAFGKTPLLECRVLNTKTNKTEPATLYEMDVDSTDDYREIHRISDKRISFYNYHLDFSNATVRQSYGQKFYLVKSNVSDEPISGVETSLFYHSNSSNPARDGVNTVINELATNKDYTDAKMPLMAQIAKDSKKSGAKNIITAFRNDEQKMDDVKFSKTKYDAWVMPARRFDTLLKIASKKAYVRPVTQEN